MSNVTELANLTEFAEFTVLPGRSVIDIAKRNNCSACRALEPHFKAAAAAVPKVRFGVIYLDEISIDDLGWFIDELDVLGTPTVVSYLEGEYEGTVAGRTTIQLMKELA